MSSLIAFLGLIGGTIIFMLLGTSPNLNGWIKASIILPIVFIIVYLLARIPPAVSEKGESRLAKIFEKEPLSK